MHLLTRILLYNNFLSKLVKDLFIMFILFCLVDPQSSGCANCLYKQLFLESELLSEHRKIFSQNILPSFRHDYQDMTASFHT